MEIRIVYATAALHIVYAMCGMPWNKKVVEKGLQSLQEETPENLCAAAVMCSSGLHNFANNLDEKYRTLGPASCATLSVLLTGGHPSDRELCIAASYVFTLVGVHSPAK